MFKPHLVIIFNYSAVPKQTRQGYYSTALQKQTANTVSICRGWKEELLLVKRIMSECARQSLRRLTQMIIMESDGINGSWAGGVW